MTDGRSRVLTKTGRRDLFCVLVLWMVYSVLNIMVCGASELVTFCCMELLIIMIALWVRLVALEFFPGGGYRR